MALILRYSPRDESTGGGNDEGVGVRDRRAEGEDLLEVCVAPGGAGSALAFPCRGHSRRGACALDPVETDACCATTDPAGRVIRQRSRRTVGTLGWKEANPCELLQGSVADWKPRHFSCHHEEREPC